MELGRSRQLKKIVVIFYIPAFMLLLSLFFLFEPTSLFVASLFLITGAFTLIKGSDFFLRGSISISSVLGISEHTIGLTVVALGTSLPELAVSGFAAYQGHTQTAWGNVIGSNITNILLILGLSVIFFTIRPSKFAFKDSLFMLFITAIIVIFVLDGSLNRYDAFFLILLYGYFVYILKDRKTEETQMTTTLSLNTSAIYLASGIVGVGLGAEAVIRGAVSITRIIGVTEIAVAATIVAIGTSLPELTASIIAVMQGHHGIAIGNIIGSNIINVGFVLGIAALIRPIPITLISPAILFFIATAVILPFLLKQKQLNRRIGFILLIFYMIFVIILYGRT